MDVLEFTLKLGLALVATGFLIGFAFAVWEQVQERRMTAAILKRLEKEARDGQYHD